MDTVSIFDAKNRMSALVEEGQEVSITRRSIPVARLIPVAAGGERALKAVDRIRALRQEIVQRGERFTSAELKDFRDEGRR